MVAEQAAWSKAAALGEDVLKYWAPVLARVLSGPCLVVDMRPPGPRAMSATSMCKDSLDVKARRWQHTRLPVRPVPTMSTLLPPATTAGTALILRCSYPTDGVMDEFPE